MLAIGSTCVVAGQQHGTMQQQHVNSQATTWQQDGRAQSPGDRQHTLHYMFARCTLQPHCFTRGNMQYALCSTSMQALRLYFYRHSVFLV